MLKLKWIICECCTGNGSVAHPAFSNGFTSSEWADMDADARQTYMAGGYDVPCTDCSGLGKVQIQDVALMTFGEKRQYVLEQREARRYAVACREMDSDMAAERRMGC